jgi:cytochrome c oxidase subunit 3
MTAHAHAHDPDVAHHFENADQQYQSAKLGMWVFLATEILFFGGLFCAYAVYRANHPEIFVFGHHFLDKSLGAVNTVILICSSFTIAWAVRAAQLKQIRLLKVMLVLTLACAAGFLCVKYVEYSSKWQHGLLWASQYNPDVHHGEVEEHGEEPGVAGEAGSDTAVGGVVTEPPPVASGDVERSKIGPAASGPAGLAAAEGQTDDEIVAEPNNAQIYFSIYFLLTGLHGIHVLGGMGAMAWLLSLARRGAFDAGHFTKVDMVALYWHLVDLIWIYLFLLLYLID